MRSTYLTFFEKENQDGFPLTKVGNDREGILNKNISNTGVWNTQAPYSIKTVAKTERTAA